LEELLGRVYRSLLGALTGPLRFRFALQPLMAILLALRAGVRDAREGRSPFLWALATHHGHRTERLSRGWADVRNLFVAAILMDLAYQLAVNDRIYVLQSVLVATSLALVPYLLLCGIFNRIARWRARRRRHASA
jgi:hypothetical protein